MSVPRLLIGGIRSGEGKTTVALGLMAALRQRGMSVQGFKVGPDYLDTGYQLLATGRPGRNLDLWMMSEDAVLRSAARYGGAADITVIEGVMGLFDGHRDGVTPTSSADVARLLGAPVALVIDAAHLAASAGAIALGFKQFDPEVQLAGVIFNRWNLSRSKVAVAGAMECAGVPILGYLPAVPEIALPSRHLGLVIAEEMREEVETILHRLAELITDNIDLDRVIELAGQSPPFRPWAGSPALPRVGEGLRIAVARDEAFAFYYPENCELLQESGADIVYFSPLADHELPKADGLYLGGGYPELYAAVLAGNSSMRESIAGAIAVGLPTYAECGGLLYLGEMLTDIAGKRWPMVGAIPSRACMHPQLQGMGYREGILQQECLLGKAGERVRGHEFHYSSSEPEASEQAAYLLDGRPEGFSAGNLFASYLHLHFAGYPRVATHWLARCRERNIQRGGSL